ncbi:NAD(P)/FAD-dependent oxidoreductase [Alterisphingorhabdus coralli]|uniref:FAD-dependent oxidoreductase n=1 Tax=Alterisphingorhabdus coralli TaxID=3071408 RepID=A0AA97I079_9SPHN|nr:FAD-dependent oxidoreductase [Parasphingorhabdus sp. SCSIO 66989]WOE74612.1 FAD-dependent oxidoreductase [Parasphingorhabdus sp. SCSIO 66989]
MSSNDHSYDAVIVGAGMAGASLAYELSKSMRVAIVEAESVAGYHATGRSAAFWTESYGGPDIQPLTTASGPWLANPPKDFAEQGFLRPRGALTIGRAADGAALDKEAALFAGRGVVMDRLKGEAIAARVPGLKPDWCEAISEPDCRDIDVAALHQAYLAGAKRRGAMLFFNSPVKTASFGAGRWQVTTPLREIQAPLLVNAAGAWADQLAVLAGIAPLGIAPLRRTIVQLRMAEPVPDALPLVIDFHGQFYFKPEHGSLWLSPHDETPSEPCDAAPEEWDVALAIERLGEVVDWQIAAVEHRWAGLRSFAPDRVPVYGHDPDCPAFFWFAGQGGYGIQTAPAAARLAASMITGDALDPVDMAIDSSRYEAARFADRAALSSASM